MKNRKAWVLVIAINLIACYAFACVTLVLVGIVADRYAFAPGAGDAVAIIYAEGTILTGRPTSDYGSSGTVYSEKIVEYLRQVQRDASVKAVVLRIDSPGGSVVASRDIYEEIVATRDKGKPVVASFSEVAASGGYFIAVPADKIYSHPHTITGSIGVITVVPSIAELTEKVGVKMFVIKSGAHKDESYGFRDLTPEEQAIWQTMIDEAYNDFVDIIVKGRRMDVDQVKKLADGRIYTGNQAKALGLVDEIGNLEAAVDAAAKLAKISGTPRKIEYRYKPGFFQSLGIQWSPNFGTQELNELLSTRSWGRMMYLYVMP